MEEVSVNLPIDVLIIEDKDDKYNAVSSSVRSFIRKPMNIMRAQTINDGEDALEEKDWSLLVLDISMDIAGASSGPMRGGHANLGGLDILERMYLLSIDIPTVVVTGFDYFHSVGAREEAEFIDLTELDRKVKHLLGVNYLGCLRYGVSGWSVLLEQALRGCNL